MSRIFVTGMGVISALGSTVTEHREALMAGKCGITPLELVDSKFQGTLPCGEIKISTPSLAGLLAADEPGLTRTALLALHAFRQAIEQAGISNSTLSDPSTVFINGTTVGGMCLTDQLYRDSHAKENGSEYLSAYDYASVAFYLQEKYFLGGLVNTINTACSSSANAIMYGARLIKSGRAKRAIVGGVDCLAKFTINGFKALHILSPEICRPFDESRNGLNLGEGAAYLVLEREENIIGNQKFAEITGYFNANDSFHPSSLSSNGEGPFLAMQGALEKAGLVPSEIDFVNAHGTATENNDEVESQAMLRLFDTPPPFASSKSNIGHTLGAAGAIEAVFSILNLQHQELYASQNFQQSISSTGLVPVTTYTKDRLRHVMSNSFGFGGNCSSLIFSQA